LGLEVPSKLGRRQKGNIGERWDPRKLRRIREDGWFGQHEAELIAAARRKEASGADTSAKSAKSKPGAASAPVSSQSEYDEALRRATAIVARAMELLGDVDRPNPGPK